MLRFSVLESVHLGSIQDAQALENSVYQVHPLLGVWQGLSWLLCHDFCY